MTPDLRFHVHQHIQAALAALRQIDREMLPVPADQRCSYDNLRLAHFHAVSAVEGLLRALEGRG